MSSIHVCPLSQVDETVRAVGARALVTLIDADWPVERPSVIEKDRHLIISVSDIIAPIPGQIAPDDGHVAALLHFVSAWDRATPLVIHCFAGISRSTAAAFISACALEPETPELFFARSIRANSRTASPNPRLVALADERLGRRGRMSAALKAIGPGVPADEGQRFTFALRPAPLRKEQSR